MKNYIKLLFVLSFVFLITACSSQNEEEKEINGKEKLTEYLQSSGYSCTDNVCTRDIEEGQISGYIEFDFATKKNTFRTEFPNSSFNSITYDWMNNISSYTFDYVEGSLLAFYDHNTSKFTISGTTTDEIKSRLETEMVGNYSNVVGLLNKANVTLEELREQ